MKGDAELLVELSTLDEVSAWIPTSSEHDHGVTPQWCELVLEIKRTDDGTLSPSWPLNARMPLRRHDGELIAEVINEVLHPARVSSAEAAMWERMDEIVDRVQRRVERGKEPLKRDVGQAQGMAMAIALVKNPDEPDIDEVRGVAMERYELRNGISGVSDDD